MNPVTIDHWLEDIRVRIIERPQRDVINPEMMPGVLNHLLREVARAAGGLADEEFADEWATDLLYEVWNHVSTNTPFGEPRGDWDYPEPRWRETLDDEDLT